MQEAKSTGEKFVEVASIKIKKKVPSQELVDLAKELLRLELKDIETSEELTTEMKMIQEDQTKKCYAFPFGPDEFVSEYYYYWYRKMLHESLGYFLKDNFTTKAPKIHGFIGIKSESTNIRDENGLHAITKEKMIMYKLLLDFVRLSPKEESDFYALSDRCK